MRVDPDHPCFGAIHIRRIMFPHLGQVGRSATLSGNATVMKGTIRSERDSSLYVPTRGVPPAIRQPSAAPQ